MTGPTQWDDAQYASLQKAYADGEYDGYWGQPRRVGTFDNNEWLAYLKGYMAGVKDRGTEPSDAQIDSFLRSINEALAEEDR